MKLVAPIFEQSKTNSRIKHSGNGFAFHHSSSSSLPLCFFCISVSLYIFTLTIHAADFSFQSLH